MAEGVLVKTVSELVAVLKSEVMRRSALGNDYNVSPLVALDVIYNEEVGFYMIFHE